MILRKKERYYNISTIPPSCTTVLSGSFVSQGGLLHSTWDCNELEKVQNNIKNEYITPCMQYQWENDNNRTHIRASSEGFNWDWPKWWTKCLIKTRVHRWPVALLWCQNEFSSPSSWVYGSMEGVSARNQDDLSILSNNLQSRISKTSKHSRAPFY